MTGAAASVVIVSRGRPAQLRRCLLGLDQQDHSSFEIIVVADAAGQDEIARMGWQDRIKTIRFDEANISAARNLGIRAAAAPIVAFIDDDAVPEHNWLRRLTAPIAEGDADAAGGFVIGRNGISFQWKARVVLPDASTPEIAVDETATTILTGAPERGIKTEGTNMAVWRALLLEVGGFDPAYRFFLDETDLNMRLAARGAKTAIVPLARVHHGFAPSDRRQADRAPRDLAPMGESLARFLLQHAVGGDHRATATTRREEYRATLLAHMVAGRILPGAVDEVLKTFDRGWAAGVAAMPATRAPLEAGDAPFLRFAPRLGAGAGHRVVFGWLGQIRSKRRAARQALAEGSRVTLYLFSFTSFYHRRRFRDDGIWEQRGGLFGRSLRTDPVFKVWRRAERVRREEALHGR